MKLYTIINLLFDGVVVLVWTIKGGKKWDRWWFET